jgi:hypothetical protein
MINTYGSRLFEQHARLLTHSGINPEQARARGYVSVDTKQRLADLDFKDYQRRVPALLIPLRDVGGAVWGHQIRSDKPRLNGSGKPLKYETPSGQHNRLDVPPGVGAQLGDPAIPLWITEGSRKADSAACAGLCCIALLGVYGWRGTNAHGAKTALADWEEVPLDGRDVVLAFDSDVVVKSRCNRLSAGSPNF